MSNTNAFRLEVSGITAGIVVAANNGFVFFSSDKQCSFLDRHHFSSVAQAEKAIRNALSSVANAKKTRAA